MACGASKPLFSMGLAQIACQNELTHLGNLGLEIVLDGFSLRTDAEIVRYPDRYMDKRGVKMWGTVTGILERVSVEAEEHALNF